MKTRIFLSLALFLTALQPFAAPGSPQEGREQGQPAAQLQEVKSERGNMLSHLRALLSPVGVAVGDSAQSAPADTYREVRIRWDAYPGAPPIIDLAESGRFAKGRAFAVTGRRKRKGTLPLQRSLELSPERLLVVGVDAAGQMRSWAVVGDPRVLRAESPEPDNVLKGRMLHRTRPQFVVNLPDDQETKELRLYLPRWTGAEYVLEPLGVVPF